MALLDSRFGLQEGCLGRVGKFLFPSFAANFIIDFSYEAEVRAGFLAHFPVDFRALRTPLTPEDLLIPQQLLALSVMDRAVRASCIPRDSRTAVLVGLGTELEMYRHKGRVLLRERLASSLLEDKQAEGKYLSLSCVNVFST